MAAMQKKKTGRVVSHKMDKTVVVSVESSHTHPLYKKTVRRTAKYKAHDEQNQCRPGDIVRLVETRPLSKEKHWRVAEIITRGQVAEIQPKEIALELRKENDSDLQPTESSG